MNQLRTAARDYDSELLLLREQLEECMPELKAVRAWVDELLGLYEVGGQRIKASGPNGMREHIWKRADASKQRRKLARRSLALPMLSRVSTTAAFIRYAIVSKPFGRRLPKVGW